MEWSEIQRRAQHARRLIEANWSDFPKVEVWDEWPTGDWRGIGEFTVRRSLARGDIWFRRNGSGHDARLNFKREQLVQLAVTRNQQSIVITLTPFEAKLWKFRFMALPEVQNLGLRAAERIVTKSGLLDFTLECRTRLAFPIQTTIVAEPAGR